MTKLVSSLDEELIEYSFETLDMASMDWVDAVGDDAFEDIKWSVEFLWACIHYPRRPPTPPPKPLWNHLTNPKGIVWGNILTALPSFIKTAVEWDEARRHQAARRKAILDDPQNDIPF